MKIPNLHHAGEPPVTLVAAIRKVLRPLVRLMLSFQITYPLVVSLLKAVYVEVAERDFGVQGKRPTDSRINLLTGVHRKDVKRLRADPDPVASLPRNISVGSQLIAYWLGTEKFLERDGKPRALALRGTVTDDSTPSFDDLVEVVCKQDIRPRVILDEWMNLGVAYLDEEKRVCLNTGAFTPKQGFEEKVFFFAKTIQDHISAGASNLMGARAPYFDRSIYYDKLSASSVAELEQLADELGMDALTRLNRLALQLQQQDERIAPLDRTGPVYRMNFGVFNYNTAYNPDSETTGAVTLRTTIRSTDCATTGEDMSRAVRMKKGRANV